MSKDNPQIIVIGVSGGSCSGKTTVARLLKAVFSDLALPPEGSTTGQVQDASDAQWLERTSSLIVHEDDSYQPTEKIPTVKTPSNGSVMDWDCIEALDISLLASCLRYVREHGTLPPRFRRENETKVKLGFGVDSTTADKLRSMIARRLVQARRSHGLKQPLRLVFLEGFLLYAPPGAAPHPLRAVEKELDARLFLPVTLSRMKKRREKRDDYLITDTDPSSTSQDKKASQEGKHEEDHASAPQKENYLANAKTWHDPPNYVEELVWPSYVAHHIWLLGPPNIEWTNPPCSMSRAQKAELVGEGAHTRQDTGVIVAPRNGEAPIAELLEWAVDEVLKVIEAGN